jgi:hypothetical protein
MPDEKSKSKSKSKAETPDNILQADYAAIERRILASMIGHRFKYGESNYYFWDSLSKVTGLPREEAKRRAYLLMYGGFPTIEQAMPAAPKKAPLQYVGPADPHFEELHDKEQDNYRG